MKISQKRQLDRFKRSLEFMEQHTVDFAPNSKALKTREQLADVIARAESNVPETGSTKNGRRPYRSDKLAALNALRAELSRISRTAALVEADDKGFKNSFQMPDKRRKEELASAARHFVKEFPKVSAKFEQFEMNADDIDKLKTALENYEAVQAQPAAKPARSPRAAASANPLINEGIELVDALDVMLTNKYNGQDEVMTEWHDASTLEVTRRRRKTKDGE